MTPIWWTPLLRRTILSPIIKGHTPTLLLTSAESPKAGPLLKCVDMLPFLGVSLPKSGKPDRKSAETAGCHCFMRSDPRLTLSDGQCGNLSGSF